MFDLLSAESIIVSFLVSHGISLDTITSFIWIDTLYVHIGCLTIASKLDESSNLLYRFNQGQWFTSLYEAEQEQLNISYVP